ncbi:MAG: O-antigen polysaccharide polymerase Wzy [Sarcina sp.]
MYLIKRSFLLRPLIVLVGLLGALFYTINAQIDTTMIDMWIFITIVIFVYVIVENTILDKKFVSALNLFLGISIIFWAGQAILYFCNNLFFAVNSKYYWMYLSYSESFKLKSQIYLSFFILFFYFGKMIFYAYKTRKNLNKKTKEVNYEVYRKSMVIVGLVLMLISAYGYYSSSIHMIILSHSQGYTAIYGDNSHSGVSNIINTIQSFFIPGLILFVSSYKGKFKSLGVIFALVSILLPMASGARGGTISAVVAFIYLFYNLRLKKTNIFATIIIVVLGLILITVVSFLSKYRVNPNITFAQYLSNYNPFWTFIGNMGFSQFPLVKTMELIPTSYSFRYGLSYLASFVAVIPSILMFGFSMTKEAALSQWLMHTLNMTYGPGYSLVAETYYNFGYFGILFTPILGIVFSKFTFSLNTKVDRILLTVPFVAIFLSIAIMSTRGSVYLLIRNIFYLIIIPKILIYILYKSKLKKGEMNEKN